MLDVYRGVFGSPNEDFSAHDDRVSAVADGLLRAYISTVQWGLAAHSMQATARSAPLHLNIVETLPEEHKGTVRGPQVFQADFGSAELITAVDKMMHTIAEQSEVLHSDALTSQAATVAVGAWRYALAPRYCSAAEPRVCLIACRNAVVNYCCDCASC